MYHQIGEAMSHHLEQEPNKEKTILITPLISQAQGSMIVVKLI